MCKLQLNLSSSPQFGFKSNVLAHVSLLLFAQHKKSISGLCNRVSCCFAFLNNLKSKRKTEADIFFSAVINSLNLDLNYGVLRNIFQSLQVDFSPSPTFSTLRY